MQQQQQQGQTGPTDTSQDDQSRPSRSDNDDTWGLGSATALDSLRRQNFRGRRSPETEDGLAGE